MFAHCVEHSSGHTNSTFTAELSNKKFLHFSGTIKDKIFTASGKDVRGYTKKGKLFLDFDTNLTEPIRSMSISGSHLLT